MPDERRILIFQTAYLGDVVLSTALISALKSLAPDSLIDIVVQPLWRALVENHPGVRQVITFDKRRSEAGLLGTISFAGRLAKENYAAVYCPHPSFRSALILRLAGIRKRVGFDDSSGAFLFTHKVLRDRSRHEVDRVLSLLADSGLKASPSARPTVYPKNDLNLAMLLDRLEIPNRGPLLGLHPGSVWATKRWLPERFGEVGRRLADGFSAVLIFGTAEEKEAADQAASLIGPAARNLAGNVTLDELVVLLSRLSLFVTNDSGPMHIAASFGVPVVAVFGSTIPAFGYTPYGTKSAIVQVDLDCRPCGPHGHKECPQGHFRCMKDIGVEAVEKACRKLFSGE